MNDTTNTQPALPEVDAALEALFLAGSMERAVAAAKRLRTVDLAYGQQCAREATEQPNPWRDALMDACAALHWAPPDDASPRDVLRELIRIEHDIALDPAVSDAAHRLQSEAAEQMRERCARQVESIRFSRKGRDYGAGWDDAKMVAAYEISALPITDNGGDNG